jgi:hypothetical protein
MSTLSTNLSRSPFIQGANFVQSNDMIYRTALDVTGFNIPVYCASRNQDERRENLIHIVISTTMGLLLVPIYVLALNKVFGDNWLKGNQSFFKLNWQHLDAGNKALAQQHLDKHLARTHQRLANPNWFDKLGFINKGLQTEAQQIEKALGEIAFNSDCLKNVYKAKKAVLLGDLLLTSLGLSLISPVKQWVTRTVAHKDRFTGSETYLSDDKAKVLAQSQSKDDHFATKMGLQVGCVLLPATIATLAHHMTSSEKNPSKVWLAIRNSMDYTSGIFLSVGGLFAVFASTNLSYLVWARDQYERLETVIKYGIACPSFFFGDHLFNGNLAKLVDKALSHAGTFKPNTFIEKAHTSWMGAEPKFIQNVVDEVSTQQGEQKAKQAGNIATAIFLAGFAAHSVAMTVILTGANALTKKLVVRDLSTLQTSKESN